MSRLMYDSVTSADIPAGAQIVAGYTDGAYAWSQPDWDRHITARHVRITAVTGDPSAHVADVETGAMSPKAAAAWAINKAGKGEVSTVYVQASRFSEVVAAFKAMGAPYPYFWIADWDNVNGPWFGSVAKQFANPATSGGHFDLSWVADYWPGVDPAPSAATPQPDPGFNFVVTPPAGAFTWAWKVPGSLGLPQFGATPPGAYTWEWAILQTPGDLGSYPGGPTFVPPTPNPITPPPPPPVAPPLNLADPQAAQATFWSWAAEVLGTDIPRWLQYMSAQAAQLRNL